MKTMQLLRKNTNRSTQKQTKRVGTTDAEEPASEEDSIVVQPEHMKKCQEGISNKMLDSDSDLSVCLNGINADFEEAYETVSDHKGQYYWRRSDRFPGCCTNHLMSALSTGTLEQPALDELRNRRLEIYYHRYPPHPSLYWNNLLDNNNTSSSDDSDSGKDDGGKKPPQDRKPTVNRQLKSIINLNTNKKKVIKKTVTILNKDETEEKQSITSLSSFSDVSSIVFPSYSKLPRKDPLVQLETKEKSNISLEELSSDEEVVNLLSDANNKSKDISLSENNWHLSKNILINASPKNMQTSFSSLSDISSNSSLMDMRSTPQEKLPQALLTSSSNSTISKIECFNNTLSSKFRSEAEAPSEQNKNSKSLTKVTFLNKIGEDGDQVYLTSGSDEYYTVPSSISPLDKVDNKGDKISNSRDNRSTKRSQSFDRRQSHESYSDITHPTVLPSEFYKLSLEQESVVHPKGDGEENSPFSQPTKLNSRKQSQSSAKTKSDSAKQSLKTKLNPVTEQDTTESSMTQTLDITTINKSAPKQSVSLKKQNRSESKSRQSVHKKSSDTDSEVTSINSKKSCTLSLSHLKSSRNSPPESQDQSKSSAISSRSRSKSISSTCSSVSRSTDNENHSKNSRKSPNSSLSTANVNNKSSTIRDSIVSSSLEFSTGKYSGKSIIQKYFISDIEGVQETMIQPFQDRRLAQILNRHECQATIVQPRNMQRGYPNSIINIIAPSISHLIRVSRDVDKTYSKWNLSAQLRNLDISQLSN